MPSLQTRLRILNAEAPAAVEMILREALVHATPNELPKLCRALTRHDREIAVLSILRRLHDLPTDAQREICLMIPSLDAAGSAILARPRPQSVQNLIQAIRCRAEPKDLSLLVPLLRQDDAREPAAEALLHIVERTVGLWGRASRAWAVQNTLDRCVTEALREYHEHRQEPVLIAAALLAIRPGHELAELLTEAHHPSIFALRRAPEHTRVAAVRRNLINWLTNDALVGPSARRLDAIHDHAAFEDLLGSSHLLLTPQRRRAIRRVGRPSRCLPDHDVAERLPVNAQAAIPRYIRVLELSSAARARHLADAATLPHPVTRLNALLELARSRHETAVDAITALAGDEDRAIASIATAHSLRQETPPLLELQPLAVNATHHVVRQRIAQAIAARDLDSFFACWHGLPTAARLLAARILIEQSRTAFAGRLVNVMTGTDRETRLLAISLARRTELVPLMEHALIALTIDRDARVVSAAVAALADGRLPERIEALRARLNDDDSRVRANAIEALGACRADNVIELIAPAVKALENRPRANAVRELMRRHPIEGMRALRSMLVDPNPLHRISALWVARCDRSALARDDVRALLTRERVPQIRRRAIVALRLLELYAGDATPQSATSRTPARKAS